MKFDVLKQCFAGLGNRKLCNSFLNSFYTTARLSRDLLPNMELFKKCFLQYECKKIFFQNSTKDRMTYNNISVVGKYQRDH